MLVYTGDCDETNIDSLTASHWTLLQRRHDFTSHLLSAPHLNWWPHYCQDITSLFRTLLQFFVLFGRLHRPSVSHCHAALAYRPIQLLFACKVTKSTHSSATNDGLFLLAIVVLTVILHLGRFNKRNVKQCIVFQLVDHVASWQSSPLYITRDFLLCRRSSAGTKLL